MNRSPCPRWVIFSYIALSLVLLAGLSLSPVPGTPAGQVQAAGTFVAAPLSAEFQEWIQKQRSGGPSGGYVPSPLDLSHVDRIAASNRLASTKLGPYVPAAWDWRTSGRVTPVRDQGSCGTCWAFGSLAALESRVLKTDNVTYDFSEQNLVTCTDPSHTIISANRCNAGGNSFIATDTLTKKGTRLETDQPYNTGTINTQACSDGVPTVHWVNDWALVANSANTTDRISLIQKNIYDRGPVSASYCQQDGHMYPGNIYYWPNCTTQLNHMVSIVGWDDAIPHPAGGRTGAWIVKNSWGTGWGSIGYFYLCYGSANLREIGSYNRYSPYSQYERLYYWDEAGIVGAAGVLNYMGNPQDYGWAASIFTADVTGVVGEVGVWTTAPDTRVEIMLHKGALSDIRWRGNSYDCPGVGYYSLPVGSGFSVTVGEQFIVAAKFRTPGYNYPIPIEYAVSGYVNPPIQTGKSYIGSDGTPIDYVNWTDASTLGWNVCVRARVAVLPPAPTLAASQVSADRVALSWTDTSTIETGFTVERSVLPYGSQEVRATLSANTTSYTDTNVVGENSYTYRVRAFNRWALSPSNELPITTPPGVLQVSTREAINIGNRGATLTGYLDSYGSDASVRVSFQWGITPGNYSGEIGEGSREAHGIPMFSAREFSQGLGYVPATYGTFYRDLSPGTTYYYRAKAVGLRTGAVAYGAERSFTTSPPTVVTLAATDITASSARLNADLTNLAPATSALVSFEYGLTTSYGSATAPQTRTTTGPFSADITGLAPNTYHFRVKVDAGTHGVSYGEDLTFTTGLTWGALKTPGSSGLVVSSPSEGNSFAVNSDGRVIFMVDIPNSRLLRSTDGGFTWTAVSTGYSPVAVQQVVMPPGDGNVVGIVTEVSGYGKRKGVSVSMNAAGVAPSWMSMFSHAPSLAATEEIADIAISPARPAYTDAAHDIIVVTRDTAGGPGKVYVADFTRSSSGFFWRQDVANEGYPPPPVQSYTSVRFSPSYIEDQTFLVVGENATGTCLNIGYFDYSTDKTAWNSAPGYPVQIRTGTEPSPTWSTLVTSDLALPSDFHGRNDARRRAYVSWDDAGRTSGARADVFRIENTTVSHLNLSGRPYSIAHSGNYTAGKLLASLVSTNTSPPASVPLWRCLNSQSAVPTWTAAAKPPTGDVFLGAQEGRAQVAWSADGTRAFASTFTTNAITTPAGWAMTSNCWQTGRAGDESAFSRSTDNGDTWNQLSYIDTVINGISDMAVSLDRSTAYVATYAVFSPASPYGSIWRSRSSPLGDRWERVACMLTSNPIIIDGVGGSRSPALPLVSPAIRLAPEAADGSALFWGDTNSWRIQKSVNAGQTWSDIVYYPPPPGSAPVTTSPGQSRSDDGIVSFIVDFAAADQNTLYALLRWPDIARVRKGTAIGSSWSWQAARDTGLGNAHNIAVLGNVVAVSSSANITGQAIPVAIPVGVAGNGMLAYSLDGGATWSRTNAPIPSATGNAHVAIDPGFATNRTIYVADDSAGGGVYRWRVGSSVNWETISTGAAARFGIVSTSPGSVYAARGSNNGGIDRTRSALNLLAGAAWDNLVTGLPVSGSTNTTFQNEPGALGFSGSPALPVLWATHTWYPNQVLSFADTSSAVRPAVTTGVATNVTPYSATVSGNLTAPGTATPVSVYFEYGTTPAYGSNSLPQTVSAAGTFSAVLTGLTRGTTYHYRAKAESAHGSSAGDNMTFATLAGTPPTVTTDNATDITAGSATLRGTLTDKGTAQNVALTFEWGLSERYGAATTPVSTNVTGAFSSVLDRLTPGMTYYYRAKAEGDVAGYGADSSFTTPVSANVSGSSSPQRVLPATVYRTQTFEVRISLAAVADNFTLSSVSDFAPSGWSTAVNTAWCTPAPAGCLAGANRADYIWAIPSANGTAFSVLYRVTVPAGAAPGTYQFTGGRVVYYAGPSGPFTDNISGSLQVQVADGAGLLGTTWQASGVVLGGVTVTLDGTTVVVSDSTGSYQLTAPAAGSRTLVASKTGYRNQTRAVNVTELATVYPVDFKGDYGLVPNAPNLSYVLACVNKWKFPGEGLGLGLSKVLAVVNAWKFPM